MRICLISSTGDPRFSFLSIEHEFNPYYNQKVQLYLQLENPSMIPPNPVDSKPKTAVTKAVDSNNVKKANSKSVKLSKSSKPSTYE